MSFKRLFRITTILLIALFFVGALPWRELRADANIHGDYNCDRLSVTYDQTSSWDLNTQGEFVITNTSEETVEGWTLQFEFAAALTITNLWNGQDLRNETTPANILIIGNEVYNGTIAPGESVSFGLIMTGYEFAPVAPLNATLPVTAEPIPEEIPAEPEVIPAVDPSTCVIFAGSDVTISGWRTTIEGNVYAGNSFNFQGSELSIAGTVSSEGTVNITGYSSVVSGTQEGAAHVDMPNLSEEILSRSNELTVLDRISDTPVNGYYYSEDNISVNAQTLEGEAVIVSEGDIEVNVDTISGENNITLYSINGNITINCDQAVLNGTVYAPNGRVTLNTNEITVVGKILANVFVFNGSVLTVTNDPEDITEIPPEPTVTVEPTVVPTEEPTATPTVTVTPTEVPIATPTETTPPTPVEEEDPDPTPTPEPIDETLDSDEDGIPDYLEIEIGTNPNDPDTDGDGLDDYLEIMVGYDPTSQDTDGNGILDGEEDLDNDGLCNVNELSLETDILSEDTDGDRLKDGEELYTYGTDPKNSDTDGDGLYDGVEIAIGKDPLDSSDATIRIEQTKIQEITNEEDPAITSVEVTLNLADSIDRSLTIRDMYNVDVRTTNVPGRIGSPLSFECKEDFDTVTVVIHYSEAALSDTEETDLGVLWYDEANGVYVPQEQAILDSSNNKITLELEHFSTYVLVDLEIYNSAMPPIFVQDGTTIIQEVHYDVFVAVNTYSSMDQEERQEAIDIFYSIEDALGADDRVTSCWPYYDNYNYFNNYYSVTPSHRSWHDGWRTENQILGNEFINQVNLAVLGECAEVCSFRSTRWDYSPEMANNERILIYITDENSYYDPSYTSPNLGSDVPETIPECSYTMYTVFLGDSYNQDLVDACVSAGGGYFTASSGDVTSIFTHERTYDLSVDEDEDGIPDYFEIEGMISSEGEIFYSDPTTKYSDEDELEDGEEVEMISIRRADEEHVQFNADYLEIDEVSSSNYACFETFIPDIVGEIRFVFDVKSDPNNADRDGDYYYDDVDPDPWVSGLITIDLGGNLYEISEHDSGYIHVTGVPTEVCYRNEPDYGFYGGYQGWFQNDSSTLSDIPNHGCGLIATNDVVLYLNNESSTYDWGTYHDSVIDTYNDFTDMQGSIFNVQESYAVSSTYVQRCLRYNGYQNSRYTISMLDQNYVLQIIIESIQNDYPVILMEDDRWPEYEPIIDNWIREHAQGFVAELLTGFGDNFERNGFDMYEIKSEYSSMDQMMSINEHNLMLFHYVTITGIIIDTNIPSSKYTYDDYVLSDNQGVYFRIQTWGEEFYIKYSDFIGYNDSYASNYGYVIVVN